MSNQYPPSSPPPSGYGSPYGSPPNSPMSPAPGAGPGGGKTSMGLDANVAALVAYVATWLSGLIIYLMEKENRFVRFHAMQAILFGVGVTIIIIALEVVFGILALILRPLALISILIFPVISIAFLIGWVFCMIKAYQGQTFKLPIIGDMAERIVNK